MIKVNFYKLFKIENRIQAVSLICNKILELDERVIINCNTDPEVNEFDEKLWVFSSGEFLPHMTSSAKEFKEFEAEIPIVLHTNAENIIGAQNLIIFNSNVSFDNLKSYQKVFFIFPGDIEHELASVRSFWKEVGNLKEVFAVNFYEQNEKNAWSLKVL